MTSRGQCPRGGGGACECPRVGAVFQFFGGRMTSRGQCPRGWVLVNVQDGPPPFFKNPGSAPAR